MSRNNNSNSNSNSNTEETTEQGERTNRTKSDNETRTRTTTRKKKVGTPLSPDYKRPDCRLLSIGGARRQMVGRFWTGNQRRSSHDIIS